jgi:hypothetical protein
MYLVDIMLYCTRLIGLTIDRGMMKTLLALFLALSLFPISYSYAGLSDTGGTLGISFTNPSPINYKDEQGYTIVLGEVENKKEFPVTGVKIWVGFYDDFSEQPLETILGSTIIDVIPPFGKSPYIIKSENPNAAIIGASVKILGFNSAPLKAKLLTLEPGALDLTNQISLSGTITNNGPLDSNNTKIHLVAYDGFEPPSVLDVLTISVDDMLPGTVQNFEFNTKTDFGSGFSKIGPASYKIGAESRNYQSDIIDISVPRTDVLQRLVTINDISVNDAAGNRLPDVSVDSTIFIQSKIWIQYASDQGSVEQPYIYYVQIKKSEEINDENKPFIHFIGKTSGTFFSGGTQIPVIEWTPQEKGVYFAETFVWDPNAVPLSSKGPLSLILVT